MNNQLTIEDIQRAVPANLKRSVSQDMVDTLNAAVTDPDMAETVRENFIHYAGVLKDGKYQIDKYIEAVMYVSFKLMGDSNLDAWAKTFPQRYQRLVAANATAKEISAHVSMYNRGQLVNKVLEQTMVPIWVLNQHTLQKAINTQAEIMLDPDVSPKVRSDAANSLMTHLKQPEAVKGQIDINVKDSSGMNELKDALNRLAEQQQGMIGGGVPIKQITDAVIIEHDANA